MGKRLHSKTILFIINAAAYSRSYFEGLAPYLQNLGYKIYYALDSHLTDYVYANGEALRDASYFTDYLKMHPQSVDELMLSNLDWHSLFSDFDRWIAFNLDAPVEGGETFRYSEIPIKLDLFFNDIFNRICPVAVLYEPVSNSFALGAYRACLARGVPFLSLSPSRIAGRIELSTTGALKDYISIEAIQKKYKRDGIPSDVLQVAKNYLALIDEKMPDYMKTNGLDQLSLRKKYLNIEKFRFFWKILRYSWGMRTDWSYAYQHGDPVKLTFAYVSRAFWRMMRASAVRKLFERDDVGGNDFLLYPLHFHPEASTSILAGDYVDELSVIRAVAFRLPLGMKLYVKEHPSAVALQPLWFYKQLARMPNVKLLSPDLNTKELIRKSRGVVTLTSTAGFEAAALNRPVLAFGNVFYRYFPNVKIVNGFDGIKGDLKWLLEYVPVSNEEILGAIAAYAGFGVNGYFDFKLASKNPEALSNVARLVHSTLINREMSVV